MKLLIVESPNKTKKLKSFLGEDWEVAASFGHIRDLPAKGDMGIDKKNAFKMRYEVYPDKQKIVDELKRKVSRAGKENVYLATDPDREGEAISFHLCEELNLSYKTTHRVTFQEITEMAVKAAISNPRKIDMDLVAAQECRRAMDRLVGFEISPVLWKKLEKGMSAGRVQSVALRMVIDRERIIAGFADRYSFHVHGYFKTAKGDVLKAKRIDDPRSTADSKKYLESITDKSFQVIDVSKKPVTRPPQPPFSTSSLQQDANRKLKFSVKKTMEVAQKLFEGGHITYMRTDSLNLSDTAIEEAKTQIESQFGNAYFEKRTFKSKAGSQEAHEAIRPTHFEQATAGETSDEQKLYDLIYRRALASQMKAAEFEETLITIDTLPVTPDVYQAKASVQKFDGYLKIYQEEADEDAEEEVSPIKEVNTGEALEKLRVEANQVYAKPPKRYNEASLVKDLENKQIGRPSTYASTISTLFLREFVKVGDAPGRKVTAEKLVLEAGRISTSQKTETLGSDKGKILPSQRGEQVIGFMEKNFLQIIDYSFTASMEENLDLIAEGKDNYERVISGFDTQLSGMLQSASINYADINGLNSIGDFEGKASGGGYG